MKGILFFLFCLPCFLKASTSDGYILLHNDTTMILTAVIQASDGSFLGQFSVQPGQQKNFTTNMYPTQYKRPGAPNISITPYTVIWQCPSEGIFSMCSGVSPGAYVKASICDGGHFCKPKKNVEPQAPASTLQKVK